MKFFGKGGAWPRTSLIRKWIWPCRVWNFVVKSMRKTLLECIPSSDKYRMMVSKTTASCYKHVKRNFKNVINYCLILLYSSVHASGHLWHVFSYNLMSGRIIFFWVPGLTPKYYGCLGQWTYWCCYWAYFYAASQQSSGATALITLAASWSQARVILYSSWGYSRARYFIKKVSHGT